jgi:uncharacterized repeat protein (TIGR02543 family)
MEKKGCEAMRGSLIHKLKRTTALACAVIFTMTVAILPVHAEEVPDTMPLIVTPEGVAVPEEEAEPIPQPAVTFGGLGDFYVSPEDVPAELGLDSYFLYGVSAADENGAALPVSLTDDGGFDLNGEPGTQYVLTFSAKHPDLSAVSGTRTAVLAASVPGVFATASGSDWERLRQAINDHSAPLITIYPPDSGEVEDLAAGTLVLTEHDAAIYSDGAPIGVGRDVTIQPAAAPLDLIASTGRHFTVTGSATLVFGDGVTLLGDNAAGGIESRLDGVTFNLRNANISQCAAVEGGALYFSSTGRSSTLYLDNCVFYENVADRGGGVYVKTSTAGSYGSTIRDNKVGGGSGGGLYLEDSNYTMWGGSFVGNGVLSPTGRGGAIHAENGEVWLREGAILDNSAVNGGGVSVLKYDALIVSDTILFAGNVAATSHDIGAVNKNVDMVIEGGIARGNIKDIGWADVSIPGAHVVNNYDVINDYDNDTANYVVTFLDWDGTKLSEQTVKHGGSADIPPDPEREGYAFSGWGGDLSVLTYVTSNLTFTATYTENGEEPPVTYTVRYLRGQHGRFNEASHAGLSAGTATPASPRATGDSGWAFDGWSPERASTVTGNVDYVAQWERVRGNNDRDDGTSLPRDEGTSTTSPPSATEGTGGGTSSPSTEGGTTTGSRPNAPLTGAETDDERIIPPATEVDAPVPGTAGRPLLNLIAIIAGLLAILLMAARTYVKRQKK